MTLRVLLLAGTAEARALAERLQEIPGVAAVGSLAGATRDPRPLAIRCRIGGFGSAAGFAEYLELERIDAVVDATHPYATRISARSLAVCQARDLPLLQLLRPPWHAGPGDDWHFIAQEEEAAALIPSGSTVFLATGRQTLHRFAGLRGWRLICRQIDPPEAPFPFPNGDYLIGRPPFSVSDELRLFERLGIDWLLVKNAGGVASRAKLDAARQLQIPVAMIARPQVLSCPRVATVSEAANWIAERACKNASL